MDSESTDSQHETAVKKSYRESPMDLDVDAAAPSASSQACVEMDDDLKKPQSEPRKRQTKKHRKAFRTLFEIRLISLQVGVALQTS